jgi:hypothetical protein
VNVLAIKPSRVWVIGTGETQPVLTGTQAEEESNRAGHGGPSNPSYLCRAKDNAKNSLINGKIGATLSLAAG